MTVNHIVIGSSPIQKVFLLVKAHLAELVDAADLKSVTYWFESYNE